MNRNEPLIRECAPGQLRALWDALRKVQPFMVHHRSCDSRVIQTFAKSKFSSTRGVTRPIPIAARDALSLHEHHPRFLSARVVSLAKLQLVGIMCLLISSKVEEIVAPSVSHFLHCVDSSYTESGILLAECHVLKTID